MIITIRGTSGSGKSTVVKRLMDLPGISVQPFFKEGRRQPISYLLTTDDPEFKPIAVLGHYEIACGGCDTIHSLDEIFQLVRNAHAAGQHVLFEGVMMYAEANRTISLHQDTGALLVIGLDTPLEECLKGVQARRTAKGNPEPLDPTNTTNKWATCFRTMERLQEANVPVVWADRQMALDLVLSQFDVPQCNLL